MIIKERVFQSRLAAKISSNPTLAKEFGLEMSIEEKSLTDTHLDNRIQISKAYKSAEA